MYRGWGPASAGVVCEVDAARVSAGRAGVMRVMSARLQDMEKVRLSTWIPD